MVGWCVLQNGRAQKKFQYIITKREVKSILLPYIHIIDNGEKIEKQLKKHKVIYNSIAKQVSRHVWSCMA